VVTEPILQNSKSISLASNSHDRVQNLYKQVDQLETEGTDMELAKVWNSQMTWNPMLCEKEQEKLISGDKDGMSSEGEKPKILTIQDEECGQTKQLDSRKKIEGDYSAMCQEGRAWLVAECHIEPNQVIAEGPAYHKYMGTEWIMANGLKGIAKQGNLVDAEADVIVNPANSELRHGDGTAKAISVAAGKELDDECKVNIKQFGRIKVGKVMCTTAGNLKTRIKHVIHAVGPEVHENTQDNLDLVQSTVLCSLEYAEHVLNSASIAIPAISSGIFGVPKMDVAKVLYQAIFTFDESEPRFVKMVQLVNLNRGVTYLINKEFAWWDGKVPEKCVSTECRTTIL